MTRTLGVGVARLTCNNTLLHSCPTYIVPVFLSQLYCTSYIVPVILSQLYCPRYIVPVILSQLYCPRYIVPVILSQLYCPSILVPVLLSRYSCPSPSQILSMSFNLEAFKSMSKSIPILLRQYSCSSLLDHVLFCKSFRPSQSPPVSALRSQSSYFNPTVPVLLCPPSTPSPL